MAPTHPSPKCPDSTSAKKPSNPKEPTPKEQESLPRVTALASMAVPPPDLLSQPDISRKRPTQKTPVNSTPPFPLAPVGLTAFAVQQDPMVRRLSSSLPPSPQPPWVLAPLDNGDLHPKKVGTHWLHFILTPASTFQDTWWQALAMSHPASLASQDPTTCPAPGLPVCSHQEHLLPT